MIISSNDHIKVEQSYHIIVADHCGVMESSPVLLLRARLVIWMIILIMIVVIILS